MAEISDTEKKFTQLLAETTTDIEQDEFQSRARFTHLGYLEYYSTFKKNSDYYKRILEMYRNCDMVAPQKNDKEGPKNEKAAEAKSQPPPTNQ